jgi:hypothetical protein
MIWLVLSPRALKMHLDELRIGLLIVGLILPVFFRKTYQAMNSEYPVPEPTPETDPDGGGGRWDGES